MRCYWTFDNMFFWFPIFINSILSPPITPIEAIAGDNFGTTGEISNEQVDTQVSPKSDMNVVE